MMKKKSKNICDCIDLECKQKKSLSVGYCKWCQKTFCVIHRLPESHNRSGYKNCKIQAFNLNKLKVDKGKCNGNKVSTF